MPLASFAYALCVFWFTIHALQRVVRWRKEKMVLPSHRAGFWSDGGSRSWHITVRFFQARFQTSRWNEIHDKLLSRLKKKRGSGYRIWLERFYTVGFVSCVVGMVTAFGLLIWTAWALLKPFSIQKISIVPISSGKLLRRDEAEGIMYQESGLQGPITPILPGVTVPLSHAPFIFAALFLGQIVHEIGHAVAGALYGVPILSSGASLMLCIPAAFVSFSTATFDTLNSSAKSRVIAAGPFHNLLFWCFWLLMGCLGGPTSKIFLPVLGYRDISSLGRVVLRVDQASPLAGYLTPGNIVTKLNDYSMASSESDTEPWSSVLRNPQNEVMNRGWCVKASDLNLSTKECCLADETAFTSLSCFIANTDMIRLGCLNPVPILTSTGERMRCMAEGDCKTGFVCVRPAEQENLLRMTVRESGEGPDKVILWTGPRREIFGEVAVGTWLPMLSILPLRLPLWTRILWEYMLAVNLSLFLFNLVPIGGLDGSHFLRSIFAMLENSPVEDSYELEALESGEVAEHANQKKRARVGYVERAISWGAGCLLALDAVLIAFSLI